MIISMNKKGGKKDNLEYIFEARNKIASVRNGVIFKVVFHNWLKLYCNINH